METKTQEQIQSEYDQLLEERSAYQQAGMTAKVAEWDYKIKVLEVSQKYERITFADMANEFGIKGLNEAIAKRKEEQDAKLQAEAQKRREVKEKAKKICGELLQNKKIGESKLYAWIDKYSWQYENDPEITSAIMELVIPKLSPTVATLFKTMFRVKDAEQTSRFNWEDDKVAFVKVERIEDYTQNDNPPFEELVKLVQAKVTNVFQTLYIAYPMIDTEKQIDPIFFGVLQNSNEKYDRLNDLGDGWFFNHSITEDRVDKINIGDMFKIAQWV